MSDSSECGGGGGGTGVRSRGACMHAIARELLVMETHLTAEISCECWVKLQRCRASVLTFVVLDGQIQPGKTYRRFIYSFF